MVMQKLIAAVQPESYVAKIGRDLIMPILFVHGVSSRIQNGHDQTWETIRNNLKNVVAPKISKDGKGDNVWIKEAYWGNDSVDFGDLRLSLPTPEVMQKLTSQKSSWLKRQLLEGRDSPNKLEFAKSFFSRAPKKLWNLTGHQFTRAIDPFRTKLNKQTTLFLGDVFYYLSRRGEANSPGAITNGLIFKLKEAHENKLQRDNEPLIVMSHSMGGQLVYDMVTYFLPEMVKIPKYQDCEKIYIDFWVAAASQVGLFKEMKVFKEDINSKQTSIPVLFPSKHLGIWWNLWDCNDYLSFTVNPFVEEVFDDMYDSGNPATTAHTAYFDDQDFYQELALYINKAKDSKWNRKEFIRVLTT